tara:strand:- start:26769 stop:27341 length:573 start_codon:yes stop_codon:yes gene_type:complete
METIMLSRILPLTALLLLPAAACAQGEPAEQPHTIAAASGALIIRDRSPAGTVSLHQGPEGVVIRIEADGLPEDARSQWHGAHLHSIGDCSSEDFTSSAGHINPSGRQHGLLNAQGPDNADLPNLWVDADGSIRAELYTTRVSLHSSDTAPALLDEDGSALVIHAGSDDQVSQPIGGAGARIACAVITAP